MCWWLKNRLERFCRKPSPPVARIRLHNTKLTTVDLVVSEAVKLIDELNLLHVHFCVSRQFFHDGTQAVQDVAGDYNAGTSHPILFQTAVKFGRNLKIGGKLKIPFCKFFSYFMNFSKIGKKKTSYLLGKYCEKTHTTLSLKHKCYKNSFRHF